MDEDIKLKTKWSKIPNSVKFWNLLVLTIFIVVGIIGIEWLGILSTFASVVALIIIIDNNIDNHFWIYFTPLAWVLILMGLIGYGCMLLYNKTIVPFNKWLNDES